MDKKYTLDQFEVRAKVLDISIKQLCKIGGTTPQNYHLMKSQGRVLRDKYWIPMCEFINQYEDEFKEKTR